MPNDEFGDFQTPMALAELVLRTVPEREYARVLEPTCGVGNFLKAAESGRYSQVIGIEVQPQYLAAAAAAAPNAYIYGGDVFSFDLRRDLRWKLNGPLLVVGNPPWVTNAALSTFGSANVPTKSNIKGLRGLDAVTGAANFDIAEYIWLKLLVDLQDEQPTIALLCKTQVARNVLLHAAEAGLPITQASIRHIDAKRWFGAMVDACLFTVVCGDGPPDYSCGVFADLDALSPDRTIGVREGRLISDTTSYDAWQFAHGVSPLEWRQGIKHDAAKVMELRSSDGLLMNGHGDPVHVEDEHVFPLLKCTDVHRGHVMNPTKHMVVPQRGLGEDTSLLAASAPRLWTYLLSHSAALDGRKSSIYRGRPRFSVFGIGPYSFAPWKVGISGLHKAADFQLVPPHGGRPVVLGDTCYFLPFDEPNEAVMVHALLCSDGAQALLGALMFRGAKRPVTKKLLQQIDLLALLRVEDFGPLEDRSAHSAMSVGLGMPDWRAIYERLVGRWSQDGGLVDLAVGE